MRAARISAVKDKAAAVEAANANASILFALNAERATQYLSSLRPAGQFCAVSASPPAGNAAPNQQNGATKVRRHGASKPKMLRVPGDAVSFWSPASGGRGNDDRFQSQQFGKIFRVDGFNASRLADCFDQFIG